MIQSWKHRHLCDKVCSNWSKLLDIRSQSSRLLCHLSEQPREAARAKVVEAIKNKLAHNQRGILDHADPRFMWFRVDRYCILA